MSESENKPSERPSPAAPATTTNSNPQKELVIKKAVAFLKNIQVQRAPLVRRVNFLMSKGLNTDEMYSAFQQAGVTNVTLKEIQDIVDRKNTSGSTTSTTTNNNTNTSNKAPTTAPPTYNSAPPPQQQSSYQQQPPPTYNNNNTTPSYPQHQQYPQYHHQAASVPPPPPQQQHYQHQQQQQQLPYGMDNSTNAAMDQQSIGWDWKDYFIATTVAVGGLFGAYKAFEHFSPFTVVRKEELSAAQTQQQQQQQQLLLLQQQQRSLPPPPSAAAATQQPFSPLMQQQASAVFAAENNKKEDEKSSKEAESAALKEKEEEITKLKTEVETIQKDLDETRKKHAMSALEIGRHKGSIQNLNSLVERVKREKESLTEENSILKKRVEFLEKGGEETEKTEGEKKDDITGKAEQAKETAADDGAKTPGKNKEESASSSSSSAKKSEDGSPSTKPSMTPSASTNEVSGKNGEESPAVAAISSAIRQHQQAPKTPEKASE